MPRLPDKFDLGGRPIPNVSRPIVSADVSAPYRAMSELGETVGKIAIREGEKANDLDYMKAKAYFNSKNIPALDTFENDPDYSTYKTRYTEQASQFKDEALQAVRNPALREKLALELDNDIVQNVSRLDKLSTAKFRDFNRVQFDEASTNNKNAYNLAKTPEERERIRLDQARLARSLSETGEDKSYIYKQMKEWEAAANKTQVLIDAQNDLDGVARALEARVKGSGATSGVPLSIRNNNPGNLRPVGGDGFRSFATPEEGIQAMKDDLLAKVTGNSPAMKAKYGKNYKPTLRNLISVYAPSSENDTQSYINKVVKDTGIPADKELSVSDLDKIIPSMIEQEGGKSAKEYFVDGKRNITEDYKKYSYVNGLDMDDSVELYAKLSKQQKAREIMNPYSATLNGITTLDSINKGELSLKDIKESPDLSDLDKQIAQGILLGDEKIIAELEKSVSEGAISVGDTDFYSLSDQVVRITDTIATATDKESVIKDSLQQLNALKTAASLARLANKRKAGTGINGKQYDKLLKIIKDGTEEVGLMAQGEDILVGVPVSQLSISNPVYRNLTTEIGKLTQDKQKASELLGYAFAVADSKNIDVFDKSKTLEDSTKISSDIMTQVKALRAKQLGLSAKALQATAALKDGKKESLGSVPEGTKADVGVKAKSNIPQAHIDALKKNPDKAADFDVKYGVGTAKAILAGG